MGITTRQGRAACCAAVSVAALFAVSICAPVAAQAPAPPGRRRRTACFARAGAAESRRSRQARLRSRRQVVSSRQASGRDRSVQRRTARRRSPQRRYGEGALLPRPRLQETRQARSRDLRSDERAVAQERFERYRSQVGARRTRRSLQDGGPRRRQHGCRRSLGGRPQYVRQRGGAGEAGIQDRSRCSTRRRDTCCRARGSGTVPQPAAAAPATTPAPWPPRRKPATAACRNP